MSGDGDTSGGASTDGAPPDLFADAPDWDAPLADLADEAAPADLAGSAGVAGLPDLGGARPDVDGSPEWGDDPWASAPAPAQDADVDGEPRSDPRRSRRARSGRRAAASKPGAGAGPDPDGPEQPRGLATGGPLSGLEPGTLFGSDGTDPAAAAGPGGAKRRRGRRTGRTSVADGGAAGHGSAEPERPLTAEERLQHALKLAYQYLTKRDRTVSEVRAHLEKREVDAASIAGALAELVEFRYLDDERYAARFVEDKRRLEGWGHLRIAQGLRRTGVDRAVADRAVAADPQRDDEAELAVQTLRQRLNGRAPEDDRARQRALRLLATKGYPLETAYAAVRTYERRCAGDDD